MKIKIKNTPQVAQMLYMDCVPTSVVEEILDKEFDVDEHDGHFAVTAPFVGTLKKWNIRAECVEIISRS